MSKKIECGIAVGFNAVGATISTYHIKKTHRLRKAGILTHKQAILHYALNGTLLALNTAMAVVNVKDMLDD